MGEIDSMLKEKKHSEELYISPSSKLSLSETVSFAKSKNHNEELCITPLSRTKTEIISIVKPNDNCDEPYKAPKPELSTVIEPVKNVNTVLSKVEKVQQLIKLEELDTHIIIEEASHYKNPIISNTAESLCSFEKYRLDANDDRYQSIDSFLEDVEKEEAESNVEKETDSIEELTGGQFSSDIKSIQSDCELDIFEYEEKNICDLDDESNGNELHEDNSIDLPTTNKDIKQSIFLKKKENLEDALQKKENNSAIANSRQVSLMTSSSENNTVNKACDLLDTPSVMNDLSISQCPSTMSKIQQTINQVVVEGKVSVNKSNRSNLQEIMLPPGNARIKLGRARSGHGLVVKRIGSQTVCPQIKVGDVIIAVNKTDVSLLSVRCVEKLLSSKSHNTIRTVLFQPKNDKLIYS